MLILQALSRQSPAVNWFPLFKPIFPFVCHLYSQLVISLNQIWRDGGMEGSIEGDSVGVSGPETRTDRFARSGRNQ